MAIRAVHVLITGRVQGVGFRWWTKQAAGGLGLDGWVRNRFDGSVEAVFSGDVAAVEAMLGKCRIGPSVARVDNVVTRDVEAPDVQGFTHRPTV